ncbi:MAG: glycosyltransferase family 39 protein [Candidatus Curtissbacteria bacterium]|nr:glycosyltransferase family 39 protein [Candidatus Curtissbacteria bacterium]
MFSLAQNYLTRSFWGDEAWTSLISQLPYGQMLKTTAADFHPPGFYTVVELVYKVLPPAEIVTRSISIVFYLLTAYMVFKLATEIRGKPFGLLSAVLVALNPIFFRYAFEARNYTMFAFAITASMYFLIKLSKKFDLKSAIPFVLFTTLGLYTHYYMFFILAAQGLYLILFDRKIFLKMTAAYVAVGILFGFWIPFLLGQLQSAGGSYWISPIDWQNTHFDAFRRILGGERDNYYQLYLYRFSVLLCLIGLVQHIWKRGFEKPYLLIWLWAIVPFVLATLPGLAIDGFKVPFRPIFFWRYLIPAAVPLSIILAFATVKLPKYLYLASIVIVIGAASFIDYNTFFSSPANFKQIYSEIIMPNIRPSDKIVTILPSFAEVLYYRNRNGLKNDLIVLPEGLVQYSGKSLLDAYAAGGAVKIADRPAGRYWELKPGPSVELRTSK